VKADDRRQIERGMRAGDEDIYDENEIWMRWSGDKVDIGERLARVVRALARGLSPGKKLRALSIGSGSEPQFRILEAFFRGGLYLLDIDRAALDVVKQRIVRQRIAPVTLIRGDYTGLLLEPTRARDFFRARLGSARLDLITLHHSLYYCPESAWGPLFGNLYRVLLGRRGAVHAVLMSSSCGDQDTTTWLYNRFAGKFFGARNDQNLIRFGENTLRTSPAFARAAVRCRSDRVRFWVDDFGEFMAVVWMILLYPEVHRYTPEQREEITEFIYRRFWKRRRPLVQVQDHLAVYRGFAGRDLL